MKVIFDLSRAFFDSVFHLFWLHPLHFRILLDSSFPFIEFQVCLLQQLQSSESLVQYGCFKFTFANSHNSFVVNLPIDKTNSGRYLRRLHSASEGTQSNVSEGTEPNLLLLLSSLLLWLGLPTPISCMATVEGQVQNWDMTTGQTKD